MQEHCATAGPEITQAHSCEQRLLPLCPLQHSAGCALIAALGSLHPCGSLGTGGLIPSAAKLIALQVLPSKWLGLSDRLSCITVCSPVSRLQLLRKLPGR